MYRVKVVEHYLFSKVQQIVDALSRDIEAGRLSKEFKLPSINEFSKENNVARDTVERAYRQLRRKGYIASYPGKGYFVLDKHRSQKKVLLVFNELNQQRKIVYEQLLTSFAGKVKVDLQLHHHNLKVLEEILAVNVGKYDAYVIIPHFFSSFSEKAFREIVQKIPRHALFLLEEEVSQLEFTCRTIYHDYKNDIFQALCSIKSRAQKYVRLALILPEDVPCPRNLFEGIESFCNHANLSFATLSKENTDIPNKGTVYIVIDEVSLAKLLKGCKAFSLEPGRDVGIISFNETIFNELLNVTVITPDVEAIAKRVSKLILEEKCVQYKITLKVVQRGSL